jgi:hypothetical protein
VGAGSSQEAEWTLVADVPAGEYRLIADGIITNSVDVTFELIWRVPGVPDVVLATWMQHFDPLGLPTFPATPYEVTATAQAIDFEEGRGDQLIFRYTGINSASPMAYVPNGDGPEHEGRYPHIVLPR